MGLGVVINRVGYSGLTQGFGVWGLEDLNSKRSGGSGTVTGFGAFQSVFRACGV